MKEFFDELLNGKISFEDIKLIILGLSQAGIFAIIATATLKVTKGWRAFKAMFKSSEVNLTKELIKEIGDFREELKKLLLQNQVKNSNSLEDLKELLENIQAGDDIAPEEIKNQLVDKITNIETKTANKQNQASELDKLLKEEL